MLIFSWPKPGATTLPPVIWWQSVWTLQESSVGSATSQRVPLKDSVAARGPVPCLIKTVYVVGWRRRVARRVRCVGLHIP